MRRGGKGLAETMRIPPGAQVFAHRSRQGRLRGSAQQFDWPDEMGDPYRGTGRTTRQIQALDQGSYFVTVHRRYTEDLARALGRSDIKILTPAQVQPDRFRGRRFCLDIDHACWTDPEAPDDFGRRVGRVLLMADRSRDR